MPRDATPYAEYFGKVLDDFNVATNRQFFAWIQRERAGRPHARRTDAGELNLRTTLPHCLDQVRAENVSRRFAGHDPNHGRGTISHARHIRLTYDAAAGHGQKVDQQLNLGSGLALRGKVSQRLFHGIAITENCFVGALDFCDGLAAITPAL